MSRPPPQTPRGRADILLATAGHASRACVAAANCHVQVSDISCLVGTVMASGATNLILLCDQALDHCAIRTLGRQGLLPRSVLCGVCATPRTARHAWDLREHLEDVAIEAEYMARLVHGLVPKTATAAAGRYLKNQVDSSATITTALIDLLVSDRESLTWPVERVARRLGVGKTRVYGVLRREGVPTVARWQMLFRLLEGCALLQRGASTEDAAYWTQLANGRSLRRAMHRHLGATVADVRAAEGWRWVVDRWMRAVFQSRGGGVSSVRDGTENESYEMENQSSLPGCSGATFGFQSVR